MLEQLRRMDLCPVHYREFRMLACSALSCLIIYPYGKTYARTWGGQD
jgi:hypothetical protein